MNRTKNNYDIIRATSEGRLYIKSSDFFGLEKIKNAISKLNDSQLIKDIDSKKKQKVVKT